MIRTFVNYEQVFVIRFDSPFGKHLSKAAVNTLEYQP